MRLIILLRTFTTLSKQKIFKNEKVYYIWYFFIRMDLGKYGYIIMLILNLFGIIISIPIIVIPLVTVAKFCRETSMTMFLIAGIMILTWSFAGLISSLCCWKIGFQEFIYMRSHVFILFIVVLLGTMAWWQSRTDSRLYTYYDWGTFKNCMVKKQVCQRNLRNGLERLSPFASHSLQVNVFFFFWVFLLYKIQNFQIKSGYEVNRPVITQPAESSVGSIWICQNGDQIVGHNITHPTSPSSLFFSFFAFWHNSQSPNWHNSQVLPNR